MLDFNPHGLKRRLRTRRWLNREVLRQAVYGVTLAAVGAIIGGLAVWGFPGSR